MRVLFCISILALVALLWASFAIARHIHQARLRRHRELHPKTSAESDAAAEIEGRSQTEENDPR
jgi:hypothetical protein